MAKHRRKKLLARAARADGFSVSTASSPGLFGPQPIPRKAESDDDDESDRDRRDKKEKKDSKRDPKRDRDRGRC